LRREASTVHGWKYRVVPIGGDLSTMQPLVRSAARGAATVPGAHALRALDRGRNAARHLRGVCRAAFVLGKLNNRLYSLVKQSTTRHAVVSTIHRICTGNHRFVDQ